MFLIIFEKIIPKQSDTTCLGMSGSVESPSTWTIKYFDSQQIFQWFLKSKAYHCLTEDCLKREVDPLSLVFKQ